MGYLDIYFMWSACLSVLPIFKLSTFFPTDWITSSYILDIDIFVRYGYWKYILLVYIWVYILLKCLLMKTELLFLTQSIYQYFPLWLVLSMTCWRNICLLQGYRNCPLFSWKSFIILPFTQLFSLEMASVNGYLIYSSRILKRQLFPTWLQLCHCQKSSNHMSVGLFLYSVPLV